MSRRLTERGSIQLFLASNTCQSRKLHLMWIESRDMRFNKSTGNINTAVTFVWGFI